MSERPVIGQMVRQSTDIQQLGDLALTNVITD